MLRPVTLRPIHFVPRSLRPVHCVPFHFVPNSLCPTINLSHTFRSLPFRPQLILSPDIWSQTYFVSYTMFLHNLSLLLLTWSANFDERQQEKKTFTLRSLLPRNSFRLCYLTKWCYSYDSMGDIEILKSKRGNPIVWGWGWEDEGDGEGEGMSVVGILLSSP